MLNIFGWTISLAVFVLGVALNLKLEHYWRAAVGFAGSMFSAICLLGSVIQYALT